MGKGKTKSKCPICGAENEHASRKMKVLCVCGQTYDRANARVITSGNA
jgi:hypothetical protein